MELNFASIEEEVKSFWAEKNIYRVENKSDKPKYYVLEMFPYPSGAGLHVGHPLGYIAADIYARYKRHKGFNVLHPMGYDAFGLPAEQYAIETGQHPAVTTEKNIARYREQLDKIGFSYDWSREVRTNDPKYYKWTQWIFLQLFNAWYNKSTKKAEPISTLIEHFEKFGTENIQYSIFNIQFSNEEWRAKSEKEQQDILMNYRLAYLADAEVNWCEALGTVLANDEVVNGVSERGGHPVVKKKMRQWFLRITAYADRLLQGLETLDWSEPMKEMQRNWIGRSEGASIRFDLTLNPSPSERDLNTNSEQTTIEAQTPSQKEKGQGMRFLEIFTTRPDTIFGASFMVLAPEHDLVNQITTAEQKTEIEKYVAYVKSRSDVERMAEKKISGCFTGAYALHPFTQKPLPIYVSEYVLNGYGTGAIMAVPSGDSRDFAFAKHFNLTIPNIFEGKNINEKAYEEKDAVLCNSEFLDGKNYQQALPIILKAIEDKGIGSRKVNYRLRDAGFSRQRYWGEPFPIYYENGMAKTIHENDLPVELPKVDSYSPGPEGQGPLANLTDWMNMTSPQPSPSEREPYSGTTNQKGWEQKFDNAEKADFYTTDSSTHNSLKPIARELRINDTETEDLIWQAVRGNQLGTKIRRQHIIGKFIVDFVSIENKLIIEIDGEIHEQQKEEDAIRTSFLNSEGFTVIRFTNQEVKSNLNAVIQKIKAELQTLNPFSSERDLNANLEQSTIEAQTPSQKEKGQGMRSIPLSEGEGQGVRLRESNTMPGYAGSSWYFLRYMSPQEDHAFVNEEAMKYWGAVDFYLGGSEHAVGHLLYSRLWTKALYDLGFINFDEPFKKMVNQGMIQGNSRFVYRLGSSTMTINSENLTERFVLDVQGNPIIPSPEIFVSKEIYERQMQGKLTSLDHEKIDVAILKVNQIIKEQYLPISNIQFNKDYFHSIRVEVELVNGVVLNKEGFKEKSRIGNVNSIFISENEDFICNSEVEKMSKSKYNVVNPDDMIAQYGADTFRMYEMFLGPIELSKPWDTKGIEGVSRFLRKFWNLFVDENGNLKVEKDDANTPPLGEMEGALKILHKTIKKINEDIEKLSYNTCVSQFMICVNELQTLKCNKQSVLEPLLILLNPFAPFLTEYLWKQLNHTESIIDAAFPQHDEKYLIENSFSYPVAIQGKTRLNMEFALNADPKEIEAIVLADATVQKFMEGKPLKKFIFVKGKMINAVV
ncbi:MAG: hypothetical protein RIQ33_1773 [Bacteroidota bacterium]|jgi:leucyl-tRNA synthetase/very-short-patch-repair endonuclease